MNLVYEPVQNFSLIGKFLKIFSWESFSFCNFHVLTICIWRFLFGFAGGMFWNSFCLFCSAFTSLSFLEINESSNCVAPKYSYFGECAWNTAIPWSSLWLLCIAPVNAGIPTGWHSALSCQTPWLQWSPASCCDSALLQLTTREHLK